MGSILREIANAARMALTGSDEEKVSTVAFFEPSLTTRKSGMPVSEAHWNVSVSALNHEPEASSL